MLHVLGLVYICLHVKQAKPSSIPSSFYGLIQKGVYVSSPLSMEMVMVIDGKAYSVGTLAILLWWFLPCMHNWLWVLCPWHHYLGGNDGNVQWPSSSLLSLSYQ
jgi:hypothetical protein